MTRMLDLAITLFGWLAAGAMLYLLAEAVVMYVAALRLTRPVQREQGWTTCACGGCTFRAPSVEWQDYEAGIVHRPGVCFPARERTP